MNILYNGSNTDVEFSEIYHPLHSMVHLRFADGYENIFFTDVETGRWTEQDLGFTELADLVGEKYESRFKPKKSVYRKLKWHYSIQDKKPIHFAYSHYKIFDLPVFEIYSPSRRYLFAMVCITKTEWKVIKIPGDLRYDNHLILELTRILEPHVN
jgi:hypothetical protein